MNLGLPIEITDGDLLCVVGPTASRKTELAMRICERVGGEVVGADSVQVYTGFDIGSGKPTRDELTRVVHHLVGVVDPREPIDAARFAELAGDAVSGIRARGKLPVVCGGAFLWVKALVYGLAKAPPASPEVRAQLDSERDRFGLDAMHRRMQAIDQSMAARINPNDWVRVQRVLEVYYTSGKRLSDLHNEHTMAAPNYKPRFVGVRWEPSVLEARIRSRAKTWLESGWIEEVQQLIEQGLRNTRPMQSVGYRQVVDFLEGRIAADVLLDSITRATKVFARRQRTWLRDVGVCWLDRLSDE